MSALTPYLTLSGTARDALAFYQNVFGGDVDIHTFEEFAREDGEPTWVAHGILDGPVPLFAADGGNEDATFHVQGLLFALLGTADPDTLRGWFQRLAATGRTLDELQERPWGDWDGQVRDQYGVTWLIGFSPDSRPLGN